MSNTFIQEAFQNAYLVEDAEEFSLNVSGPGDVESFLDVIDGTEDEVISDIYDLEAEAKEELKQSYIGKVILDCNVCHSNVFFDRDQITEDEDGLCCVDIECPYCMSNEGYTIIGEVKPYGELEEVPEEEEIEEPEEEEVEDNLEEGFKADEVKELRGDEEINGADGPLKSELEGSDEIRGPKYTELGEGCEGCEDEEKEDDDLDESLTEAFLEGQNVYIKPNKRFGKIKSHIKDDLYEVETYDGEDKNLPDRADTYYASDLELNESLDEDLHESIELGDDGQTIWVGVPVREDSIANNPHKTNRLIWADDDEEGYIDYLVRKGISDEQLCHEFYIKGWGIKDALKEYRNKDLHESIENVSIDTDDETMTMTTKEDGGVVVETSPIPEVAVEDEVIDDAEMIAPLEPETEAEIEEVVDEEPGEDEFEEFDEESFDQLGESYLKRCYENVTSFKTSNITINESKEFIIEGKIGFDSGNEKDTQFIFTSKNNENGKLKLEGYNKQINTGKKTFKLNCSVNDKALVCESLNYNYKSKNDLNESVRVYGTVKRK